MNVDDVLYIISFIFSICFGSYYRTIKDRNAKKNVGTAIGILLMVILAKTFIIHLFVTTFVNALIILYINKRRCHLVSLAFSFPYLMLFRPAVCFGASDGSLAGNLALMMLTLKLVGLAFEVNTSYMIRNQKYIEKSVEEEDKDEATCVQPTFLDIFHYAFTYIGILAGPYYRYRTFIDHLNHSFAEYANWKREAFNTLKFIPFYAITFFWVSHNWPISYMVSKEFSVRSWVYRYWYIWPTFLRFRMRMYMGFLLSNAVLITAGLGAYPSFTKPRPGQGPSQRFSETKKLLFRDNLSDVDFNFESVQSINSYEVEFCTTYREAIKHWNMTIQYWLAVNVYKRFPWKKYRTFATLLVSSLWHSTYFGFYLCILTAPLVLVIEDIYHRLSISGGTTKYQWIHWFFKMHFFSYQAVAFQLISVQLTLQYYNSVYHMGALVGLALAVVGWGLLKLQENNKKMIDGRT